MDHFRAWKSYARAAESALFRAGYNDLEYAVRRTDVAGAAEARWAWNRASADLTSEEWPDGLMLVWSSSTGWGYQARPSDQVVALPVPVLASPEAIVALLPALTDGRRNQLPVSEDRWEHAESTMSWVRSASLLGDDKYDAAYQREEEAADTFLRWQEQLDGQRPMPASPVTSEQPVAEELARRHHVEVILESALKDRDGQPHDPDPDLFGLFTDFFTRAVVFPGQFDWSDDQTHTSAPSRALAHLLVQYLNRRDLELEETVEGLESSVAPVGGAMAECIAQALRGSRWFEDAVVTGSGHDQVAFRTVFGSLGTLHVADHQAPAGGETV
ncbi:hypothetical protein HET69_32985 [Streptomyces sp. CJ_13]|uniref:hypothetical protein n=1 Tax=Streptomyces sp. CJ_13 TaxID=2724943 RepID=UPI001BDDAE9F|nr:hypothetical protein [Streptomyces sp. CJ_13]MBT1188670.1 hypothetical protein [Streptomyces sp. CJ_13]